MPARASLTRRLDRLARLAATVTLRHEPCPECDPLPGEEHRVVMILDDDPPGPPLERRRNPATRCEEERCSTCGRWFEVHRIVLDLTD